MSKGKELTESALADASAAFRADPSIAGRIAETMTRQTGRHFWRQEVATWLRGNSEPGLGTGLLLLRVWKRQRKKSPKLQSRTAD